MKQPGSCGIVISTSLERLVNLNIVPPSVSDKHNFISYLTSIAMTQLVYSQHQCIKKTPFLL